MKVVVVNVSGSIGSLNVAPTWVVIETLVSPSGWSDAITRGATVSGSAPVVKVQVKALSIAFPARSRTAVVIVAVYVVLTARLPVGRKVAMLLRRMRSYESVPGTARPPGSFTVKVRFVIVAGSIGSLNVAAIVLTLKLTPVAAFAGTTKFTVGGVESGKAPVRQLSVESTARPFPARSRAPVVIRTS